MIQHNDHATEQDVRMYKFVWNKVSKIRSDNKIEIYQLEKYLEKMIDIFHPADELFLKTSGEVFHWCYNEMQWEKCLRYGLLILPYLSEYLGEEHSDIAFLSCRIGNSCLKLGRFSEAKEYFEKANNIYKYVPGISSSFYQNEFLPLLQLTD